MIKIGWIRANAGVSLIEVLVAFVILAMSITVLLRIFSSGTSNLIISQQYVDAVRVAESQLASVGVEKELLPFVEEGVTADRYAWRTTVEPYSFYQENEEEIYPVTAFRVVVEVSWFQNGHSRQIELSGFKLKNNKITMRSG